MLKKNVGNLSKEVQIEMLQKIMDFIYTEKLPN